MIDPQLNSQQTPEQQKKLPMFGRFKKNRKLNPEVVRQLKDESSDYR